MTILHLGWIVVKTVSLLRQRDGSGGENGIEDNLSGDGSSGTILRSERKSRIRRTQLSQIFEKSESWDEEALNTTGVYYTGNFGNSGTSGNSEMSSISQKLAAIQALVDDLKSTLNEENQKGLLKP
jgi:hypothetical protein